MEYSHGWKEKEGQEENQVVLKLRARASYWGSVGNPSDFAGSQISPSG
jgi:hypothetical protein